MSTQNHGFGAHPAAPAFDPAVAAAIVARAAQDEGYGIPVYWPGDHIHVEKFDNVDYVFEPKSLKMIYGTLKHQVNEQGKALLDRELETKLPPDRIVKGLMEKARDKGLRVMTNNEASDARKKAEGRADWVRFRLAECDRILADHEMACARAAAASSIPPRPNAAWRLAKHDIDRLTNDVGVERKRFICLRDGMDFDSFDEFRAYVAAAYPGVNPESVLRDLAPNDPRPSAGDSHVPALSTIVAAAQSNPALNTPELAERVSEEEKQDAIAIEIQRIFATAGAEGITIPDDIRMGLKSGEPDTIAVALDEARRIVYGDDPTA